MFSKKNGGSALTRQNQVASYFPFVFHKCVDLQRVWEHFVQKLPPKSATETPTSAPNGMRSSGCLTKKKQQDLGAQQNYPKKLLQETHFFLFLQHGSKYHLAKVLNTIICPKNSDVFAPLYASSVPPGKKNMFGDMTARRQFLFWNSWKYLVLHLIRKL